MWPMPFLERNRIPQVKQQASLIHRNCTFYYKERGKTEQGFLLSETPYTYFVQFSPLSFGTVYKELLWKVVG